MRIQRYYVILFSKKLIFFIIKPILAENKAFIITMNKAIYIGAGVDIVPALLFPSLKEFIFIDSQPFSEFGSHTYHQAGESWIALKDISKEERFNNLFSRPLFLSRLESIMNNNNFKKSESNPDYLIFNNDETKQTIKYYYSIAFPNYIDESIIKEIKTCNTLIVCGHDPHVDILSYLPSLTYFIGNDHTVYESDEFTSTIGKILDNPEIISTYFLMKIIKKYDYWLDENIVPSIVDNYKIIECHNLKELEVIRKD